MRAVSESLFLLILPVALAQQSPFLSVPPVTPDSIQFVAPLPDFEAKDITGRTWRLADLHGKFTLICLWHTFEARFADKLNARGRETIPGLPDLPELQRFYDKVKDSANLQVLTFCVDYDYTHARDYMNEKNYTFPVIADWSLAAKLINRSAGANRLVNPDGQLSAPFHSWSFRQLLFEIEKTAEK